MSEETQQGGASPENEVKPSAEQPAAGSQPETNPSEPDKGQAQDSENNAPADGQGKPSADAGSGEQEKPKESGSKEDSKPKSRRSAQYRIEQLARENAELRKKAGLPAKREEEQPDEGDPKPDDSKATQPDISKQVREEATRLLEPVLKEHSKAADDAEINELFTGELAGKRSEFEPQIRKAWELDQYKDLAASDVFKILSFDKAVADASTKAVEEFKKAEKEAKESSGSGTSDISNRSGKGGKAVSDMTPDEFRAHNERIKAQL